MVKTTKVRKTSSFVVLSVRRKTGKMAALFAEELT